MKLNLDRDFYIGGVPHVEDGLVVHENFTGCIENMYLNHSNVIAAFKDQFGYEDDFYRYGESHGVARFFLVQHTKTVKNVLNEHKMAMTYTRTQSY
jgi:hypothetical protein